MFPKMDEPIEISQLGWVERLGADILKMGPLPKHVAIILDGNRRFAGKAKLESTIKGHVAGLHCLQKVAHLLFHLGVKELTVYIFSIENFKRSAEEVSGIMEMLEKVLEKACTNLNWTMYTRSASYKDQANKEGICCNFIGNLELTPSPKLRKLIEGAMLSTKDNSRFKVNLAFIYTGRIEVTLGTNRLLKGLHDGKLEFIELNGELLKGTFALHPPTPVDILIRTSGETRLSDFMTWTGSEAFLVFVEKTWPEIESWDILQIIFKYQSIIKAGFVGDKKEEHICDNSAKFLEFIRNDQWQNMIQRTYTENKLI